MKDFDLDQLTKDLKIDARGVGIPEGAAEVFIKRTLRDAQKSLKHKSLITEGDLKRTITKELKKYNADLAYVYEFRDKIV